MNKGSVVGPKVRPVGRQTRAWSGDVWILPLKSSLSSLIRGGACVRKRGKMLFFSSSSTAGAPVYCDICETSFDVGDHLAQPGCLFTPGGGVWPTATSHTRMDSEYSRVVTRQPQLVASARFHPEKHPACLCVHENSIISYLRGPVVYTAFLGAFMWKQGTLPRWKQGTLPRIRPPSLDVSFSWKNNMIAHVAGEDLLSFRR